MRALLLSVALPVMAVVAACSSSERRPAPEETAAKIASPIINGNVDTTHQAVVALYSQQGASGGLCSGSIIKVDAERHIGWVLTAGHCVTIPPVFVFQGDDYATAKALRYEVVDYAPHPQYDPTDTGSPYDFAMVRIAGVDAATPVLPIASASDGLVVGTSVVSVGYGMTTLQVTNPPTENTVRRNVAKKLSQVGQAQIGYDMSTSGICHGDSGGPVLVTQGGVEKVAGVHSYVSGQGGGCDGFGVSVRVSFGLSFINAQLAKAIPTEDCALCEKISNSGNSTCAAANAGCLADKDCKSYFDCISAGTPKATCVTKFPKAEGPFNAAANCTCTTACPDTCGKQIACRNIPKCGYKLPAGNCATCSEGACCAETLACAADGTCYVCLKGGDADPACATNAARKAMATCVASKCTTECAGSGLENGAELVTPEDPAAAGGGGSTTTTTGCAVTQGGAGGRGFALAMLAGVLVLARRRRRASV